MNKSVYDTNDDGIVDNAEKVNGHTVNSDVPQNAKFTDTTYSEATTTKNGLMSKEDKTKLDGIEKTTNLSGKDLNECIGKIIVGYGNDYINKPSDAGNGYFINISHPIEKNSYNKQFFINRTNNEIWERNQENGSWKDWETIINKEKNFITVRLSEDYTITTTNTYETMPTTTKVCSAGTKLTQNSSGCIVVGEGVKHIRISGNVYWYTGTVGSSKNTAIYQNTTRRVNTSKKCNSQYQHINLPSKIISVAKGDLIKLAIQGTAGDLIKNYDDGTFMTVEVVD